MDALIAYSAEPTGPEWFYESDFGARYGLSMSGSHKKLNMMLRAGLLEKWKGRILGNPGQKCKYRLKQPAHKKGLQKRG